MIPGIIPRVWSSTERNPNSNIQGFAGFNLLERATGNLKCSQKTARLGTGIPENNFIPKGNFLGLPVPGDGEHLEHFHSSKSGFVCFSLIFRSAAACPGEPGSDCANRKRSLESPRSCHRGFGDNSPPPEFQEVSKPCPRRAGSSPGFQRDIQGARSQPEPLESSSCPSPALPHTGKLELFHPLGPSPIPWELLGPMERSGSHTRSMQENLGMHLDGWEGAGWTNPWIRMERDCSWSPDPRANPQRWSWESLGASGSCWNLMKVQALRY